MFFFFFGGSPAIPLRLYYQVEKGRVADLEVISRASIAFAEGLREIAYILDPSITLQIGISGHTDGSLWQDNILSFRKNLLEKPNAKYVLAGIAISGLAWLMAPPAERARDEIWRPLLEKYLPENTDPENDIQSSAIKRILSNDVSGKYRQQFFREAERDTAILGVGATIERERPTVIIPRSDFSKNSGRVISEEIGLERSTVGEIRVILISPVLEVGPRRWKFATAQGEFGASIRDKQFLRDIVAGKTSVRMRSGIEMEVQLETRERLIDGVWTVFERNVLRVDRLNEPPASRQELLFPEQGGDE